VLIHHSKGKVEPGKRSLRADQIHVEQVGTVIVEDSVESQAVAERPREVGDEDGRFQPGDGLSAPGK